MASFNKFQTFVNDLAQKKHNLSSDVLKVYLSNTTPNAATMAVKGDLAEITEQNGYTAPVSISGSGAASGGTYTLTGTNITITASGGTVGPFEFVVLYNSTAGTVPLIAWWDYGSALTLNSGDAFVIKFNNGVSSGTVLTLT